MFLGNKAGLVTGKTKGQVESGHRQSKEHNASTFSFGILEASVLKSQGGDV